MRFAFLKDRVLKDAFLKDQCGEWIRRDKRLLLLREGMERGRDELRGLGCELTELGDWMIWRERVEALDFPLTLRAGQWPWAACEPLRACGPPSAMVQGCGCWSQPLSSEQPRETGVWGQATAAQLFPTVSAPVDLPSWTGEKETATHSSTLA